ncbi:hypothetical protein PR202_ga15198 [Eleusine coracana subsp. coracana]|uniref:Uncharacterized protein n=1 Tax=Eleusine coracana subsp. coracana TaxID=191504 RepID=A0AAV5CJ95_ELECO|nr:hypothetical protein PR202_ga15198 [Eleusine coracana subsp. coracana]
MNDCRTAVKAGELCVNRSWLGMEAERHLTKSPEPDVEEDEAGAAYQQRKQKPSTTSALETVAIVTASTCLHDVLCCSIDELWRELRRIHIRKYDAAVDNVLDAILVDAATCSGPSVATEARASGKTSWKVKLVPVPPQGHTSFLVLVTVDQGSSTTSSSGCWSSTRPQTCRPSTSAARHVRVRRSASRDAPPLPRAGDGPLATAGRWAGSSRCSTSTRSTTMPCARAGHAEPNVDGQTFQGHVREEVWAEIFAWLAEPNRSLMIMDPMATRSAACWSPQR